MGNKTDKIDIVYDNGVDCERFIMDNLDFSTFLATLDEKLGLVLRNRKNLRNGTLNIPDYSTFVSFQKELTYQNVSLSRKEQGVTYLRLPRTKEESIPSYEPVEASAVFANFELAPQAFNEENGATELTAFLDEMRDPTLERILEEDPRADPRDVMTGLYLLNQQVKEELKYFN